MLPKDSTLKKEIMMKKLLHELTTDKQKNSQKVFVTTLVFLVVFLFSGQKGQAQNVATDYTFAQSTGVAYTPITTGTTVVSGIYPGGAIPAWSAAANTQVTLPFTFVYNNINYTNVYISDNGFIALGVTVPSALLAFSTPISGGAHTAAIAGYAMDLRGGQASSRVSYETIGAPGSQTFVVQYEDLQRFGGGPPAALRNGLMNFQIRLNQADGSVEVIYRDFTSTFAGQINAQVGLRGLTNADFNNRVNAVTFNGNTQGIANNSLLGTSSTYGPVPGTQFKWTPCFNPTALVATMAGDNTTVNISWTNANLLASPGTYYYEVRSSGGFGTGASGLFASGTTASTPVSVPGLAFGTPYTIYLKSSCKPGFTQFLSGTVTPSCSALNIPYTQNFESITAPAVPACNTVQAVTGALMRTRDNTSTAYYGFNSKNMITGNQNITDTWYFTQGLNLVAGTTYRLSYKYGGSREAPQFVQKMRVHYGIDANSDTNITAAEMTTLLADHNDIKESPLTFVLNFTPTVSQVYYIGFQAYQNLINNGFLQLDDISVSVATCYPPTPTLPAGQITSNSAIIAWTAAPNPPGGYEYYFSSSPTTPISTTPASGINAVGNITNQLSGLTPTTTYYYWVRSLCGGGDKSQWSTSGTFTTLAAPLVPCSPNPSSVDSNGIINVTVGSINNTTGREAGNYGNYSNLITNIAQSTTVNMSLTYSIVGFLGGGYFTRIWIDFNDDGDFFDAGETVFDNGGVELPNGLNNISFNVPAAAPLGQHRMRIGGADSNNLSQIVAPATTNGPCYTGAYGTFEDYSVYVTVAPPALSVLDASSATSVTICSGSCSPLVSVTTGFAVGSNYSWSPNTGISGSLAGGYTFCPTTTTTYTLTATQTSGSFLSNTATYVVNVKSNPTPISIAPVAPVFCQGVAQALTATGGIISGVTILEENFNSAPTTFTTVNNSVNGSFALAYWTLRPSPYSIPAANTDDPMSISSNDVSQFYMSDSDIQGSAGNTNEELISPVFSMVGFTDATLSFWHYYKGFSNGSAQVQVSTNGGGAWVTLPGAAWTTATVGSPSGFVNVTLDLSSYATAGNSNSNMRIRFVYVSNYGYRWCVDNVRITGSNSSTVVWSPATELWLDPTGTTTPYAGTGTSVVYAKMSANRVYTATATTLGLPACSASSTVSVTVTPLSAGTAAGDQVVNCGNLLSSNITLSGYFPSALSSIARWEWANNSLFSGVTTIPGSANLDTLTPALLGTIGGTTYIRAVIIDCGTLFSNTVTLTVPVAATFNAGVWTPGAPSPGDRVVISTGTYTVSANTAFCSMQVLNGANVVVNSGVTLTIDTTLNVAGAGNVTFNNGASLMQNSAATTNMNSGNITYRRDVSIRRFDYTYWSSPVVSTLVNFSPLTLSDKYLRWDANAYNWVYLNNNTAMTAAVGYAIRAPQLQPDLITGWPVATPLTWNGSFVGRPNNGDYNVTIFRPSAVNNRNLIGNPYPSSISADALMDGNVATLGAFGVGTSLYFWTHNTALTANNYNPADFAVYNRTGGTAGAPGVNNTPPTGIISTGQAFMIAAINPGVVTFRNSMRVSGSNTLFYRATNQSSATSSTSEKNRLWLDFGNATGEYKQLLVGYVQNATNEYEDGFDAPLFEAGNSVSFYSITPDNNLTIQGRALPFVPSDIVPLGYMASSPTSFEIALTRFDGLFEDENVGVYLEDTFLNVVHNLKQAPYTFVTEAGTFDSRFVLRYTNPSLSVNPVVFNENSVIAYKKNESLYVKSINNLMKSVQVYDVRGRLIMEKDHINGNEVVFENPAIAQQVLMVQIITVDGSKVTKKIIY